MCLILFSLQPESKHPLVVAANRDEFYARPARAAHYWEDAPSVFAGRDSTAGGTWLGITREGRFAALTNFSAGDPPRDYPASRGELVANFLTSRVSAADYAEQLGGQEYAGFNLLVYDGQDMHYVNNKGFANQAIAPGVWGLSNAELTADWPKATDGARALQALEPAQASIPDMLGVLMDRTPPADERIPERNHLRDMPLATRRTLAARFISGEDYGTRAMTLIRTSSTHTDVYEQQVGPGGATGSAVFARVPRGK